MITKRDLYEMSLSSLFENKLRAFLSLLGITIGIAAVFVIFNVSHGGKQVIYSELETLGLTSAWIYRDYNLKDQRDVILPDHTGIDLDDYQSIVKTCCSSITILSPVVNFERAKVMGLKPNPMITSVQGVNEQFLQGNGYKLLQGRKLSHFDIDQRHKVAVITESVRDDLGLRNSEVIGSVISLYEQSFTLVGLVKNKDLSFLASIGSVDTRGINNYIYIPYSVALSLKNSSFINTFYLETKDVADTRGVAGHIVKMLEQRHKDRFKYKMDTMDFYISVTDSILGNVTAVGVLSALATVLVGSIGVMNMMSTSVVERTSEIGLRKAIGASTGDIKAQILLESLMLTSIGSVIGLALGVFCTIVASKLLEIELMLSFWSVLLSIGITLVVGVLSGYFPAKRAAGISPVQALNDE